MSHALTPSSPLLHSHMDFYPPYFFTNTLIPFHLASFTMTPIPLLALYTHFITSILTTIITSPSKSTHSFPPHHATRNCYSSGGTVWKSKWEPLK